MQDIIEKFHETKVGQDELKKQIEVRQSENQLVRNGIETEIKDVQIMSK